MKYGIQSRYTTSVSSSLLTVSLRSPLAFRRRRYRYRQSTWRSYFINKTTHSRPPFNSSLFILDLWQCGMVCWLNKYRESTVKSQPLTDRIIRTERGGQRWRMWWDYRCRSVGRRRGAMPWLPVDLLTWPSSIVGRFLILLEARLTNSN